MPSSDCPENLGELWYICMYCRRAYREMESLIKHKKEFHKDQLLDRKKLKRKLSHLLNGDLSKNIQKDKSKENQVTNGKVDKKVENKELKPKKEIFDDDNDTNNNSIKQRKTRSSTKNTAAVKTESGQDDDEKSETKESKASTSDPSSPAKKRKSSRPHPFSSRGYKKRKGKKSVKTEGINRFPCEVCTKISHGIRNYQNHLNSHDLSPIFNCNKCDKQFAYKSQFKDHQRKVHKR